MRLVELIKGSILAGALVVCVTRFAVALPFNTDMYTGTLKTGDMMRPQAKDTVPLGSLAWRVENREAALALENPQSKDPISTLNGQRLFAVNCSPCHGKYNAQGKHTPGAVASMVPGPDISADFYKDRTDGNLFGTIHFGGMALMPAYGWKLSITEHWDLVNYIRHIQGKN